MLNRVSLIGNLGADPEVKTIPSGKQVCEMRLACTEKWTSNGEKQERTEWVRVVVWDKLAENCGKYLAKGRQIYVEGKLQTRSWDDKNTGENRYLTEVVAHDVKFLGGNQSQGGKSEQRTEKPKGDDFGGPPDDDDVPF
jgi:single-strand DNA-binding protein